MASVDTEELFDGTFYAQYQPTRNLMADNKDGCKIKVYQLHSVALEKSCDRRWTGTAGSRGINIGPMRTNELVNDLSPELRRVSPCKLTTAPEPAVSATLKKTSRQPSGLGTHCLWSNETDAIMAADITGEASKQEDPLSGHCQDAALPYYPYTTYQGRKRLVVLQTRMPQRTGDHYRATGMAYGIINTGLKDYSLGTPIPASRFSRSAAEAFLRQPAVVPLTNPAD